MVRLQSSEEKRMMHLRCLGIALAYLILIPSSLARIDKGIWQQYRVAKACYAASDYATARKLLLPLLTTNEHDIVPYALFYYALSAYHSQKLALAEDTFAAIVASYPDWEQKDEVWYWLSQISFEVGEYAKGLARLTNITDGQEGKSVRQMKAYFLQQTDDIVMLQALFEQYPEDRDLAKILFYKVIQQPFISRDFGLLSMLKQKFGFSTKRQDPLRAVISMKKDSYNVGVCLPFFVDEVDYEEENSNDFVIALYQGIKAAVSVLAEQGIDINLHAYDTKKDAVTTAAFLAQPEIKEMDLIIGPLYAATIPLVSVFAKTHGINFFNPLSENSDVVGTNSFAYLFKPSLETQARKAAKFTLLDAGDNPKVIVIYDGASKAETKQANVYRKYMERHVGRKVVWMHPVTPKEAQNALHPPRSTLSDEEQIARDAPLLGIEHLTHIYVPSGDELIVTYVIDAVENLSYSPCIIGHEAWLQQDQLHLEQLKRLKFRFVAPNYIDYAREGIYHFRNLFYKQFAQYPNHYACIGYEMMLFLGRMLNKHGVYFQKHWHNQPYPGVIFGDTVYDACHDNQQVPIIKFHENRFVRCHVPARYD